MTTVHVGHGRVEWVLNAGVHAIIGERAAIDDFINSLRSTAMLICGGSRDNIIKGLATEFAVILIARSCDATDAEFLMALHTCSTTAAVIIASNMIALMNLADYIVDVSANSAKIFQGGYGDYVRARHRRVMLAVAGVGVNDRQKMQRIHVPTPAPLADSVVLTARDVLGESFYIFAGARVAIGGDRAGEMLARLARVETGVITHTRGATVEYLIVPTRAQLLAAVARAPSLLILDDPTRELDFECVVALRDFINEYSGAIVIRTPDRGLINACRFDNFNINEGVG